MKQHLSKTLIMGLSSCLAFTLPSNGEGSTTATGVATGVATETTTESEPITQPEIELPEDWAPLQIPDDIPADRLRGLLKGGASKDGKKGALLSILPIKKEKFKEMEKPLEQLAWVVKEGDKGSGFTPTAEREVQTTLGKARVITSQKNEGSLQTWIILHENVGVFLKLFTLATTENPQPKAAEDPELKAILKSLRLPPTTQTETTPQTLGEPPLPQ